MYGLIDHELTIDELNVFGASEQTVTWLTDNDMHVVVKKEYLEIWHDYKLQGVIAKWSAEQLNEFVFDKISEV